MSLVTDLYKYTRTAAHSEFNNNVEMIDCIALMEEVGFGGVEYEKQVAVGYVYSKMTIIDEMEDFSNYENLLLIEFIEFLGRMAEQVIKSDQALNFKLEYLLSIMF